MWLRNGLIKRQFDKFQTIVLFLEIEIHQLNKWKSLFLRFEWKKTKKMKDVIKRFPSFYDLVGKRVN